jgi:proteasome lid subunit RPN8/RPN11
MMSAPAKFTFIETQHDLPWRSRGLFPRCVEFGDEYGTVLVLHSVMNRLRERSHLALPVETGGLLAGRVFRDEQGPYTVVLEFVEAAPSAGGLGLFRLSPEATHAIKDRLALVAPACDVVGWFHSHPSPMHYSQTDRANQRLWSDPNHVGILVFATGTEFGALYQDPDSRLLRRRSGGREGLLAPSHAGVYQPPTVPTRSAPPASMKQARRTLGTAPLMTVLIAVLLLQLLILHRQSSRPTAPIRPLVSSSSSATSAPASVTPLPRSSSASAFVMPTGTPPAFNQSSSVPLPIGLPPGSTSGRRFWDEP